MKGVGEKGGGGGFLASSTLPLVEGEGQKGGKQFKIGGGRQSRKA